MRPKSRANTGRRLLLDALQRARQELTRENVMRAALSLEERDNPFLLPGVVVRTPPTDRFPIEQVAVERWDGGHWSIFLGVRH